MKFKNKQKSLTGNKPKTVKYFSAFTGIGGFELGILQAYVDSVNGNKNGKIKKYTQADDGKGEGLVTVEGKNIGAEKRPAVELPDFGHDKRAPHCVGYSEIDKYACQIYQEHFPEHKNYGDITKINTSTLPDFDLFVGGFPCQSFSIAGKRKGFADTRGTLFFEIARIIGKKKPGLLLLENVKGLLSHDCGRTFWTIIYTLDGLGYDLQWQVLNSKDYGVPQNRERVFIIGHLGSTPGPEVFPICGKNERDNKAVMANTIDANYFKGADNRGQRTQIAHTPALRASDAKRGDNQTLVVEDFYPGRVRTFNKAPTLRSGRTGIKIGTLRSYKDGRGFREIKKGISPTLPARARNDGTGSPVLCQNLSIRRLTPIECERLQGFPDGWTANVSDTQRYKTLGNAVTVNVIREIIKRMFYNDNKKYVY